MSATGLSPSLFQQPPTGFEQVEGVVLMILVVGFVFWLLIRKLASSRPEFRIGVPVAVAYGLRVAAIAAISMTGLGATLRGGDETEFLHLARILALQPLGHGDLPHGRFQLQTVVFALEMKLGFLTEGAMRIVQVGIALVGVILILAVVYDLAGRRAARFAAWFFAFEPGSTFFDSALHKDPNMELAAGLVVFGGAMLWRRLDVRGIFVCALGCVIAVETRAYAGWFLVAAAVLLLLHAALRHMDRPLRAVPAIYAVVVAILVATPVLLQLSSKNNLQALQNSVNANASGAGESSGASAAGNGDNLALEQVNVSSRGAILRSLPTRIRELIAEPYPWQLADTSQRLGAIGTLVAYAVLLLLLRYAWLSRGQIFARAGPLLYPLFLLTMAYALSVGNAGTGFRYRTHLVTLAIAAMVILREHVLLARQQSGQPALEPGARDMPPATPVASPV
jgi:hypothetical protein